MPKNNACYGLREIMLTGEALGALARETASRGLRPRSRKNKADTDPAADRRALLGVNRRLRALLGEGFELPPEAELLTDSFYVVEKALALLEAEAKSLGDLRLPADGEGERTGLPRVYAMALDLVGRRGGRLEESAVSAYLTAYQATRPLSMRELRALPGMLRLALVRLVRLDGEETLARAEQYRGARDAAEALSAMPRTGKRLDTAIEKLELRDRPACAERLQTLLHERDEYAITTRVRELLAFGGTEGEALLERDRRLQARAAARLGDAIASLRWLDALDERQFFESNSNAEAILREDPVYPAMDAATRADYRAKLEELSRKAGAAETVTARMAQKLAREGAGKAAHVGWYLTGEGREAMLERLRPDKQYLFFEEGERLALYLMGLVLLMLPLLLLAGRGGVLALAACLLPAWSLARAVAVRIARRLCPVKRVPRMAMEAGVPPEAATLVAVPVLILSEKDVNAALERLQTHYLANPYNNCFFAVLGDFADAAEETRPGEDALLALARQGTAALNARYGAEEKPIFFFLHRKRELSPYDGVYMGRERKRGALCDLMRLAETGEDSSFLLITAPLPQGLRYCLTLDADTVLPQEALLRLIGAMEHPLNRPEHDPRGVVISGYGVIVPRMRQTLFGAEKSRFAALVSPQAGADAYAAWAGEFYQDVFGTGLFGGKGIFDIRAFRAALENNIPDNAVLSHDLLEGCYLRAGFMGDVALFDAEPAGFFAWWKRQHRWVRGDWQLLPFLLPRVRDAADSRHKNPLSLLSRAKMAANLLASALPAAVLISFCLMPFTGGGWYGAIALIALCQGAFFELIGLFSRFFTQRLEEVDVRGALHEAKPAALRAVLDVAALPYAVFRMRDAQVRTLYRVLYSRRNMLEWQTAAHSAGGAKTLGGYAKGLWPCLVMGGAFLLAAVLLGARTAAALLSALFLTAPMLVMYLDAPEEKRRLTEENEAFLRDVARRTWAFFERFCTEENGWLPPDNFQVDPLGVAVRNTSPTNIGMAMLSAVAARELGFLTREELLFRLEKMTHSIEKLEKWNGHLYNWYSLKTMSPLSPRYVSTVDSGNLAACLLTAGETARSAGDAALCGRMRALAQGMDFTLLADKKRKLFSIGFDCAAGQLSPSRYDLLASEARLTSFLASALHQVSPEYYASLSRLLTEARGRRTLVSWSGTMFEYLMPVLLTGARTESILGESAANAVAVQREAMGEGEPWGVSESGYYAFDRAMLYQYRAFGVRELALCPAREAERVTAPYAAMLALMCDPNGAALSARRFAQLGALGELGLYEAVDFTARRLQNGKSYEIVKSYMAHHQGMALCAAANALNENCMVSAFFAVPEVRAAAMLLEEKRPSRALAIRAFRMGGGEENAGAAKKQPKPPRLSRGGFAVAETQLLTNGGYTVFLTDGGLSSSRRGKIAVTRFDPDPLRSSSGVHMILNDGQRVWPVTAQPGNVQAEDYCVTLEPWRVVYEKSMGELSARMEVYVSPSQDGEVRLLTLMNHGQENRRVEAGVFAQLALAPEEEDKAHPAFVRLTVEAEREKDGILFHRRSARGEGTWAYASLFDPDGNSFAAAYSTDGLMMPGRDRSLLQAMKAPLLFKGEIGSPKGEISSPLEPELCARGDVLLKSGGSARFAFLLGAADSREKALSDWAELREGLSSLPGRAWAAAQSMLRFAGISPGKAELFERIGGRIALRIPQKPRDTALLPRDSDSPGVEGLWRFGISGDMPMVLMKVSRMGETRMAKTLLELKLYLAARGVAFELVFIGGYGAEYSNELRHRLEDAIRASGAQEVRLIHGYALSGGEEAFLRAMALIVVDPERSLDRQFAPQAAPSALCLQAPLTGRSRGAFAARRRKLAFDNGLGGFEENGEYVIALGQGKHTPLPWCNVLANESFGALVTETGGGYAWYGNSREHKLTPWYNDAVRDPKGEWLLLTDPEDGAVWSLTAGPLGGEGESLVRHGFGYSEFETDAEELNARATVFVDDREPIKVTLLTLRNPMMRKRRVGIVCGAEWVLGSFPRGETVETRAVPRGMAARSLRSRGENWAFLAMTGTPCEACANREAVLSGGWAKGGWESAEGNGSGFSALRGEVELGPGETRTVALLLGEDKWERMEGYLQREPGEWAARLEETKRLWRERLSAVRVKTPDEALNLLMNGRLLYQTLASRVLGKTGFYQCGGATGFRDQLQDMLALLPSDPQRVREHLLLCAARQFPAGDVLHWWHAPARGVRTHIQDDRLFLPYVATEYALVTGDASIWEERAPYLEEKPIPEGKRDLYGEWNPSELTESLYDHCARALDSALATGTHGLPLMGGGDWNDGMDCVGERGGESVWLAFFLMDNLARFAPVARDRGQENRAAGYEAHGAALRQAAEGAGWDGAWYRRAFFADGSPLGSRENRACRIDLLSQAWAGIVEAERAGEAFDSAMAMLVQPGDGTAALLTPPFEQTDASVGYISAYVPGVRENGGQYTHAAVWLVKAACALGRSEEAQRLMELINPIRRTENQAGMLRYMGEPYVLAADVYTNRRCPGRAGWTWYTGAAAWLYKVTLEDVLGVKRRGERLFVEPCTTFEEYAVEYRFGSTTYTITVKKGESKGEENGILLRDDGLCRSFTLYRP